MSAFNQLPRSIKKTVRYILQDTDEVKLLEVEKSLLYAIYTRKKELENQKRR
ncbi:LytR family transcriptional regulator [Paraliobacillus zengyii]|uniref:LytR family transcriptional regulator n=1 Tax=Paraliobacillus zengyii TaxID=2213194 RepID=UPI000E3C7624|nr:LytR family transcriptional regulator [Paraliobacillus zengyii]